MMARAGRHPRRAISESVLSSAYFCAFFAAGGVTYPYFNLFFQEVGMTNQQIGVLAALPPLITVVASPLWASLADRFNLHRVLLPGLLAATLLPALFLPGAALFWVLAVLIMAFNFFLSPTIPLAENAIIT
ncbi:MAG: MFS transporter, partial [Anaerolineae bacterium]|nr:MFS transporter [Anaerolineae bacterium]